MKPSELDVAAQWHRRLEADPGLRVSAEFHQWVAIPANAESLRQVTETWSAVGRMSAAPEIEDLRRQAREAFADAGRRPARRAKLWAGGAIAASLAVVVGLWSVEVYAPSPQIYQTGAHGRRVVRLDDGSRLTLDAGTEVQARLTPGRRRISLQRGQARFDVAHDAARPFTVTAGDRSVLATGTVFDVDLVARKTIVTLLRGRVVVSPTSPTSAQGAVALRPGDRLVASAGEAGRIEHVGERAASAWEDGKLLFDDTPLDEVIARIDRYSDRRWSIDPALRSLRISGVFHAGDVDAFLDALSTYFAVSVSINADRTIVLRPAPRYLTERNIAAAR